MALLALAAGFGQFGAVAALGDVSKEFGHVLHGATVAEQAGLSGTELGLGLAIIRLASLASLPLTGAADRFGRRPVLLTTLAGGLMLTVAAAGSPSYWWFVVIFATGRPLLSATGALVQVVAAEHTGATDRAKAVALVTAGYGVGAGLAAIVHSLAASVLGFRGLFALASVPLVLLPLASRWVVEPDRYAVVAASTEERIPVLGAVGRHYRQRLIVVAGLTFAMSVMTGPANSFVFLYAQDVLHQAGYLTAAMVAAAGVTGLIGLLTGRWLADRAGRRVTGAIGVVGVALFGTLAYSGSKPALLLGYVLGVLAGSVFAPAVGALFNELFPTSVRASVAGWLLAAGVVGAGVGLVEFGAVADAGGRWAVAAPVTFLPAAAAVVLFWCVPETRGREPEDILPAR